MRGELEKKWLGKLTKLNAATGSGKCRGKAPHKPLLLLCLCMKLRDVAWFPHKKRRFLHLLAKRYADLNGGYYTFKPMRDKAVEEWETLLQQARGRDAKDIERACELALLGGPARISDFYLKPHYVLLLQNGTRVRLVTLHNIHGVNTPLLKLPSEAFSTPTKFRHWLLDNSTGATWKAGERELNDLQADVAREVAFKDVAEIPQRGYHEDSKCWFFGDVTFDPNGRELFADKHGIVWVRSLAEGNEQKEVVQAYKISDRDHEGQTFRHGEPLMRPTRPSSDAEVRALFQNFVANMFETLGNHSAFMFVGALLSCGAGPEIYDTHNAFPGLWVHGEPRQGKSSVARWGMALWGQNVEAGMPLKDCTKVGLSIALQQYGNLLVWLEEYQPDAPSWMIEKIKNIYGRESGSKKTFEEGDRKIIASAIVTGVATSSDAQLRSRYIHVQVAEKNRKANHYDWFEKHRPEFFKIGRYIMRNRKQFAIRTLELMHEWLKSDDLRGLDGRAKIVHGAAWGALNALAEMLGSEAVLGERDNFRNYLMTAAKEAVAEVDEQINVNQFWRDLLDGLKSDAFGETPAERRRVFKLVENTRARSPVSPLQLKMVEELSLVAWKNYTLYFQPGPVIDMLRAHKVKQGRELPLEKSDLRNQMKQRAYWVPPKSDVHRKIFEGSTHNESCWAIDLNAHELGYQSVSDADFVASFKGTGEQEGLALAPKDWVDPRKGDLFAFVDALHPEESK